MRAKLEFIGGFLSILGVIVAICWWMFGLEAAAQLADGHAQEAKAHAEMNERGLRSNAEQIQLLTDIHLKEQGARELRAKLCLDGKLKGEDCRDD